MPNLDTQELRVLVLAPTGRDANLIADMLQTAGLPCGVCNSVQEMAMGITCGAGLALMAEEALIGTSLVPLLEALAAQPAWSDFPIFFLTSSGTRPSDTSTHLLDMFGEQTNVTILERPIRVATLLSGVRSGLRARRRQHQVREYLHDRERHKEELLQTQKLESLGVLAGGVAHDFNNLLTGILGNASLALEVVPPGNPDICSALADVIDASERAAHLTKQLLAYAGKGRFVIEALDLSLMVKGVTHLVQAAVSKHAILQLSLAPDLPAVEGDAAQLQQIVMNLAINAAEAIPANRRGEVFLTTSSRQITEQDLLNDFPSSEIVPGLYVVLEVQDNGSGMTSNTLSRIFDPFFTTKFTGRGLGLAAVQGIVRGHKGALKVWSSPDEGSRFTILLPASDAFVPPVTQPVAVARETQGKGFTVLVIDDEEVVRKTARAALQRQGYQVLLAQDGPEGVALFEENSQSVSLVILDLTMPGMGGEEVFRLLKKISREVKVVISSGFNEGEVVEQFEGRGLAGFLQKPYTSGTLASTLNRILSQG